MATFKFGRTIDLHWNGYDIQGPAETVFSIPDQLYEEFNADIAPVEPTLTWIDTNEFNTLKGQVVTSTIVGSSYITTAATTAGTAISIVSGSATSGYVLTANGTGGVSFQAAPGGAGSLSTVIGVSPASVATASGTATVSIDQAAITGATSATNSEVLRSYVKNSTGSTINKGSVVYITGSDGTNALIGLSSASTEATSSKTLGILASTLTNNAFGYVIKDGQLSGIDTSAATAGSSVWLGNTLGSFVFNTPPAEPSHSVYLGVVTKANASTGEIVVKVQNGYELDELHDVSAASPTDLDILQYKSSSALWTKASIANAGIAASTHTHAYQAAGTYVNAVIGTSPASVSTASGTSTVSIVAGSINSTHLSATSVGSSQLIAQSVTTAKIGSGAAASATVLTSDGIGGASFAAISGGRIIIEKFTTPGTSTWIRPSGVSTLLGILVVGGGGGGASGEIATAASTVTLTAPNAGGNGGKSTAAYVAGPIDISESTSYSVVVGAGGTGAAASTVTKLSGVARSTATVTASNAGTDGGASSFGSFVSSNGGLGGTANAGTSGSASSIYSIVAPIFQSLITGNSFTSKYIGPFTISGAVQTVGSGAASGTTTGLTGTFFFGAATTTATTGYTASPVIVGSGRSSANAPNSLPYVQADHNARLATSGAAASGGSVSYVISAGTTTAIATAAAGQSVISTDYGASGGGGGWVAVYTGSAAPITIMTGIGLNLSSGAGGNGAGGLVYIAYVG
jgi:hypothetical protein